MKNLNLFILIIFIFILLLLLGTYKSDYSDSIKRSERDKIIIKLNKCFDLDNKSSRGISKSLKLVEYCIDKYGINK